MPDTEPITAASKRMPNLDWHPGLRPCSFATMDWFCVLLDGHFGPHRSEEMTMGAKSKKVRRSRPLGIADLAVMPFESGIDKEIYANHWYWCRRHERAEHLSYPGNSGQFPGVSCIRIGPFMSEHEANRLLGVGVTRQGRAVPLGMEVEA